MIYIELGRCFLIMKRKLLKVENCILKYSYKYLRLDAENIISSCMNWARDVKRELFSLGLGEFWIKQKFLNVPLFLTVYNSRKWDIHIQEYHSFFETL